MKIAMTDTSAGRTYWYFLDGQWVQVSKLTGMTSDEKTASLLGRKAEADHDKTIDVTDWPTDEIIERFFSDGDDLHPNRDSEDYKLVEKARASGKMVDTTGMTREEFKLALLGKHRRVVTYDDLTPEQKAIVDASNRPGTPVPSGLSKEELIKLFKAKGGDQL